MVEVVAVGKGLFECVRGCCSDNDDQNSKLLLCWERTEEEDAEATRGKSCIVTMIRTFLRLPPCLVLSSS